MNLHLFNCRKKPNKPLSHKINNTNTYILFSITYRDDKSDLNFKVKQSKLEWALWQEVKI